MKIEEFVGKNKEELLENSLTSLNTTKDKVLYNFKEQKGGLFKSTSYTLRVAKLEDVTSYLKEYLEELTTNMGLKVTFETKIREEQITIKMYSDNNPILIGKNGKTLAAIQALLRQKVFNEIEAYPYIILDVENYKEKQALNIERLAKRLAREVLKTKVEVKMENMNSYERRLVHNVLTDFKHITTTSEGEEPNRHVIIKYKED